MCIVSRSHAALLAVAPTQDKMLYLGIRTRLLAGLIIIYFLYFAVMFFLCYSLKFLHQLLRIRPLFENDDNAMFFTFHKTANFNYKESNTEIKLQM